MSQVMSERPMPRTPRRKSRFPFATTVIALMVIAGSAGALFYFSNAKIEITPNNVSAAVQGTFSAGQGATDVPYKLISVQKVASQSVKGSGTKTVTAAASGMITIYNTQPKAQALVTNTRFATTAGLIYRIHAPVSIPAGSAAKPGSVSVKVYADQPGSSYNVGPSSFTIPGFAGTPQASQVYARSTVAMAGGASGTVPVADASEEATARASLTTALGPDLEKSLAEQVPAGYVLLNGAATTTYQSLDPVAGESGQVELKVQGTATAVVFPNAALAKAIGTSVSGLEYRGEPLTLTSPAQLTFSAASIPADETSSFSFSLSGTAPLVYTVDTARIAAAVAGKTSAAAEVALTNYPEVSKAFIVLRPFWKTSFPEDPAAITIVVLQP